MMDDISIFGESSKDHDTRVRAILLSLEDSGVTPNSEKSDFTKSSIAHLCHVVSEVGVRGISRQGARRQGDSTTKMRG